MMPRIALLLTLVSALATGAVSAAPRAAEPHDGLFRPATVHSSVTLKHTQSVGVLVSDDTLSNIAYLARYRSDAQRGVNTHGLAPEVKQAYVDSADPDLAIAWLNSALEQQFAQVTFYRDLGSLVAARPDVVVMIDSRSQLFSEHNADVQTNVTAQFFDANFAYIGKAEGHDALQMSPLEARRQAAQISQQRVVQINALQRFDASLQALIKGQA
ncbi:MAG: ATPase [Pseudomonas sp.]|uniref:ATPase n=1 Tax=Pseudomonas abieticivorans TaxID=2931382 RepID=UPI0020C0AF94|nr:ATPase [Pseudomonas sp. PIA16]MDE1169372.1 ATPase [Pseudomonas sp.]